ncbi:polysaccharide biosynthesis protein [Halarsenatibacter silvermanii]|uniref:NDP-sugar epimerase, includes UDP-GlcNAc-inverting 4,6-dehydratase FlaA1 and capsular polysaccharide biosynthesis protein EpsC n=1 Tax=Halarsenatibacter silvermanii TaxID=321763 RepID=A0A1G9GW21_9FIRM|nr:nucleoside-diphosphate sugar epimerase/dehydratase [Halarsenatibacter silvermanii]SDL04900.1 NDP-sugar epimerase, includes UDP-GlcNAc-inverting 4,6-dehydratase FlaA1 and capsular polysaccharide biosynthesis protein EpsC [Halarsenatibacter silvermanii]
MLEIIKKIYRRPFMAAADLLLLNICLALSYYLRFEGGWLNYFELSYIPVITVIGVIIFNLSRLYNRLWEYASIGELISVIKTGVIINLLFTAYNFFWQQPLPRSIPLLNTVLLIFGLGGLRLSLRLLSDYLEQKSTRSAAEKDRTSVLIVGAGDAGEMIIREMKKHPEFARDVVALVDDDPAKQGRKLHGIEVKGGREDLPRLIEEHEVEEVIIAIPSAPGSEVKEIFNLASRHEGVKVKTVPGVYELINGDVSIDELREVRVEDLLRRDPVQLHTENISSYLEGHKVMVTGGGGSIGSELCRQVAEFNPSELLVLDIYENSTYLLLRELRNKFPGLKVRPVVANVQDEKRLENVFRRHRPRVVFHAAAHKHVPLMEINPGEAVKNNVLGTYNTARLADKYGVDRFVQISTDKAVNPTNIMGASKRAAEMVIQDMDCRSDTRFMAVRFGNVLGSCGSVVPIFKEQIASGGPVTVTHREVKRYFMTIPEAAQLVIQAGSQGEGGEVFILDMGEPVKIIDLARDLISLSGYKPGEDIEIEITGLRPGEKLFEELMSDIESSQVTEHERIYISDLEDECGLELNEMINRLEIGLEKQDAAGLVQELANIVESYQPDDLQQKRMRKRIQ